jgi:hypothetical protein
MIEKQGYWVGGALARGTARTMLGLLAFAALTLGGGEALAQDADAEASASESPDGTESSDARAVREGRDPKAVRKEKRKNPPLSKCSSDPDPDKHPHDDPTVCPIEKNAKVQPDVGTSNQDDLASKIANPSAPVMALKNFVDVTQNGGSAPGAHRATFQYTFQPALPFPTKLGNVILRPAIEVWFGQPYVDSSGNVQTAVGFGNFSLDSFWGKTLKNGLMVMGGFNTTFPSATKTELRADWAIGPEALLGYVSPKSGSMFGTIWSFTWKFPTRAQGQTVAGQYFYAVQLGKGFQFAAQPVWSYSRETKVLRLPIGVGLQRVMVLGKKKMPFQLGVQIWGYLPPPDASGPEWTLRFTIAPVVPLPWKK